MSSLSNPAKWFLDWFRGGGDETERVTPQSSLKLAAVWYAHNLICGHLAQMPLDCLKRRKTQGADQAKEHPAWQLVRNQPNAYQTADVFKEQVQGHALMWGNGRAAIIRSGNQRVTELIPLMPDRTMTFLIRGEKFHVTCPGIDERILKFKTPGQYRQLLADAMVSTPDKTVVLNDRDVLHIAGFGFDGIEGQRLFDVARESWGIGLSAQNLSKKQMNKAFAGKLFIEAPDGMFRNEQQAQEFLDKFKKHHNADQDGEVVGLLVDGMKANVIAMTNQDAQFIESRKFDRQEIMLWFGLESVPGDDTPDSYAARVEKNLAYLQNCLNRWLVKWEMQCNTKLLTEVEKRTDSHFFKFNTATLLRSNTQVTATTLGNLIVHKIINTDEARDLLDMPPRADGMGGVYENPAIAVATKPSDTTTEPAKNTAIKNRLTHLLGIEAKKALSCCKKPNFVEAVEAAYQAWIPKMQEAYLFMGLEPDDATAACVNRKESLLTAAETVTATADLSRVVEETVQKWKVENA